MCHYQSAINRWPIKIYYSRGWCTVSPFHPCQVHNYLKGLMTFWWKIKPSTACLKIVITFWFKIKPSDCRFTKYSRRSIKRPWPILTRIWHGKCSETGKWLSNSNSGSHCHSTSGLISTTNYRFFWHIKANFLTILLQMDGWDCRISKDSSSNKDAFWTCKCFSLLFYDV